LSRQPDASGSEQTNVPSGAKGPGAGQPGEATWHYLKGLGRAGPVTTSEVIGLLLDRRLGPSTLMLRTDRSGWRPAGAWPEFEVLAAGLSRRARARSGVLEDVELRYLRKRAVALFALFLSFACVIAAHATAVALAAQPMGSTLIACASCAWWLVAAAGGVYAAWFLRRTLRWLVALPPPLAAMGLVGSIGLIGVDVATVVLLVLW
jgi:hypothetical protein